MLPADEMFGGLTEDAIFGELERELPVDDFAVAGLAVRVESVGEVSEKGGYEDIRKFEGLRRVGMVGAEGRPADKTFEHDGAKGPPVAAVRVTLTAEDFRSNVVWGSDGGVGESTTGLTPVVHLAAIADG